MPTPPPGNNSSGTSIRIRESSLLFPDLPPMEESVHPNASRLALAHAASLLPSAIHACLEPRNAAMNPDRFVL